jgi:predicted small lipoprotein YifL
MTRNVFHFRSSRGRRFAVLLGAVLWLVLAGGCGKKGPLYLPEPAPAAAGSTQEAPP